MPEALAPSGSMLEMQNFRFHPRLTRLSSALLKDLQVTNIHIKL